MTVPANGYTGAFAIKSNDTGGILRYFPCFVIDPTVNDGQEPIPLINNVAYPVNTLQGTASGVILLRFPLLAGVHNADFFARAILGGVGDTGASGYHTVTAWSDNLGADTAKTYGRCKVASLALTCAYSQQAAQSIAFVDMQVISCDPESGSVAALAAPASGPLSRGKILAWAQSSFAGVSDTVSFTMNVDTGFQFVPGNVAGTNPAYPSLPAGAMLNTISGRVTLRQIRNPTTALQNGTLGAQFGTAAGGGGVNFAAELRRMNTNKRQAGGINFVNTPYFFNSNDGSTPLIVADAA